MRPPISRLMAYTTHIPPKKKSCGDQNENNLSVRDHFTSPKPPIFDEIGEPIYNLPAYMNQYDTSYIGQTSLVVQITQHALPDCSYTNFGDKYLSGSNSQQPPPRLLVNGKSTKNASGSSRYINNRFTYAMAQTT